MKFKMMFLTLLSSVLGVMAADNYVRTGESLNWVNRSGSDVANGSLINMGTGYGVALQAITNGGTGVVRQTGVWRFEISSTDAFTNGLPAFYSDGETVTTTSTTNDYVGMAVSTATGSTSTTVYVDIQLNAPQMLYAP